MDELCRDLVKPIVEGPEPEPEVDTVVDEENVPDNSNTPAAQAAPAPALPPIPQVPLIQDKTTSDAETNAIATIPVKAEAVEVQVKTEDIPLTLGTVSVGREATDQENVNPPVPSIPNSFSSETTPKVEECSQPGPSCIPPQPWEYVVVARDEEHIPIEELLNCLAVEELQSLVKSFKVKCASKKVSCLRQWNGPGN